MMNGLQIMKFDNKWKLNEYLNSEEFRTRFQLEQLISSDNIEREKWYHYGFCECCGKTSRFLLDWLYCSPNHINFRERLVCEVCDLNNRQRFTFGYMKSMIGAQQGKRIYLYEQVTPLYHQVKTQFSNCEVIGSEYLGFDKKPGEAISGIQHEDAMNLSFQDETMDLILSNEVYEHVPDVEKCFKEASRILKPKGTLLFTIPFYHDNETSSRRCELVNGELVHYKPEEYHGNPIADDKGSLVFYDYGWDILDICKKNGFSECSVYMNYSYFYGYMGTHFTFIAQK